MKTEIEDRLLEATQYGGKLDLIGVITRSARDANMTWPDWFVAIGCMTVAEYAEMGQGGSPWLFLGTPDKRDMATNCRNIARRALEKFCRDLGIDKFSWHPG